MLNLTIPPQVNTTSSDSTSSANTDASTKNSTENEQFNKILAKETDKSANTASNKTAPTEKVPTEQSNAKSLPQIPENTSKLAQTHFPRKLISFDIAEQTVNEPVTPFAPIISIPAMLPTNESIGYVNNQGQTIGAGLNATVGAKLTSDQPLQQNLSRHNPTFTNSSDIGQHSVGYRPAYSATSDQILPPRSDASSTIMTRAEESIKLTSSETIQPSGINNLSSTTSPTLSTTPSTLSTTSMPQSLSIDTQVGQPKWGGELAQKVVLLSSQQQQVAEIRLNPAHLGPVEIMLNINSDQATVQFVSSHLAVREAIEASLPRLREMMVENGITLGDVSVGAESFQQQADTQQNNEKSSDHDYSDNLSGMNEESTNKVESSIPLNRHNGIVNTFA